MASKPTASLKKLKLNHQKEISSLKKCIDAYKTERKSEWKSFKKKMKDDISKIEKSMQKLAKSAKA